MENEARIVALNEKFSMKGIARIAPGNGGLPRILIETEAAKAEIYLHGAQITSWQPACMGEVLFVSERSQWADSKAIRGGIPICFPWFRAKADNAKAPSHGFVRTQEWKIESVEARDEAVCARFSTASDDATRNWWPFDFELQYSVMVGKSLQLELAMKNTGNVSLQFEEALHTYFKVEDVRRAHVCGLDGLTSSDNRDGDREKMQQGKLILTQQTDNAYKNAMGPVEIVDELTHRLLRTNKENSNSTIVWNPWSDGAAGMTDFAANEWERMLCVEGGNILSSVVSLAPQQLHKMTIVLEVMSTNDVGM